jgi:mono/diheme cytochrome c family protein
MSRSASRAAVSLAILAIAAAALTLAVYVGLYNVAADAPHSRPVLALLEVIRARSIAVRAREIGIPDDLDVARRISAGASLYKEMCSGCHLAPGLEPTEISKGLYPKPPNFSLKHGNHGMSAAQQFWVIKHGIKMTAMPAWGATHSDAMIWDMVAFIRRLPSLSAEEYRAATTEEAKGHNRQR